MANSQLASDADITRLINTSLTELYDLLVEAAPPDYYLDTTTVTTVAGTTAYTLPVDFRSIVTVLAPDGSSGRLRAVEMFDDSYRSRYIAPQAALDLTVEYVKAPPVLVDDADTFDGVSGWDELIVLLVARQLLRKQRRDVSMLDVGINEMRQRIQSLAPQRQMAGPLMIRDVEFGREYPYIQWGQTVDAWRLVGSGSTATLQLYSLSSVYP